jgi:hypothetical protein
MIEMKIYPSHSVIGYNSYINIFMMRRDTLKGVETKFQSCKFIKRKKSF